MSASAAAGKVMMYFMTCADAVSSQQGDNLAQTLSLKTINPALWSQIGSNKPFQQQCRSASIQPRYDMIAMNVLTSHYFQHRMHQYVNAYNAQVAACEHFLDQMGAEAMNWYLPALNVVTVRLRACAYMADAEEGDSSNNKTRYTEATVTLLRKFFQKMIVGSRDDRSLQTSKKMGCYSVAVNMMRLCFKLNNIKLCITTVKPLQGPGVPPLHSFPKSQVVTFFYYMGRLAVLDEKYTDARQHLNAAFAQCHRAAWHNKRRILQYLIPIQMLAGVLPSRRLLDKYHMHAYRALADAVKQGNLRLFNTSMVEHQQMFIQQGVFLILEKLKLLVYRNLLVRVWKCEGRASKISLNVFQCGFRVHHIDMDMDELECILANMIFSGFMKGYIAHRRAVVLKKDSPFPTLTDLTLRS